MSIYLLSALLSALLAYLSAAIVYQLVLAAAFFLVKKKDVGGGPPLNRFGILVPAHNEELLIATLCESLLNIHYPRELYEIFIVADNCSDATEEICKRLPVRVLRRNDPDHSGKGQALQWGLQRMGLEKFDAVFIVDADNVVSPEVLSELNQLLNQGEQAIQCYNAVGNRDESWFTQLLYVSRTIGNLLYHEAKYKLGLSSYLMGNGLCFSTELLRERGWTAFSVGEDWEYYAQLVEAHVRIGFAARAKVYHQESRSLNQATSQRLRWSSGRFHVARTLGLQLLWRGLRERDLFVFDSSLPLIFPNYSLQVSLSLLVLPLCLLLPSGTAATAFAITGLALVTAQFLLFVVGVLMAGSVLKVVRAMLHVPVFLLWKSAIDLLSFTGLYRSKKWVRTERHMPQPGGE